jgi:hypothetical protein
LWMKDMPTPKNWTLLCSTGRWDRFWAAYQSPKKIA